MRLGAVLLAAVALAGCRERPTQVLVRLATDIEDLRGIRLLIQDGDDEVLRDTTYLDEALDDIAPGDGFQEIGSFGIVPRGGDASRRFRVAVEVEGLASDGEVRRFETAARSSFLSNRQIRLDIFLAQRCLDTDEECEEGFTCGAEECVPEEVDPNTLPRLDDLPLFDPRGADAGVPTDAALDASPDVASGPRPRLRFPHAGFRAPGNDVRLIFDGVPDATRYEIRTNGTLRETIAGRDTVDVRVTLPSGRQELTLVPCDESACFPARESEPRVFFADRPRCDLDGDGRSDIAFSWRFSDGVETYLSVGDTQFIPLAGPTACGDLDGDGNDELVVGADRADPEIGMMDSLLPDMPDAVVFADTDGDGTPELHYAIRATGEIKRFTLADGARVVGTGFTVGRHMVAADTNADGIVEVVLTETAGNEDTPGPALGVAALGGGRVDSPGGRVSLFGGSLAALGPDASGAQGLAIGAPLETAAGVGHMPGAVYLSGELGGAAPVRLDSPEIDFSNFPTWLATHDPQSRSFMAGFGVYERHPPDAMSGMHQGNVYLYECDPECAGTALPPMPPTDDTYFGSVVIGNLDLDDDGEVDVVAIARHLPTDETTTVYRRLAAVGAWERVDQWAVNMIETWVP